MPNSLNPFAPSFTPPPSPTALPPWTPVAPPFPAAFQPWTPLPPLSPPPVHIFPYIIYTYTPSQYPVFLNPPPPLTEFEIPEGARREDLAINRRDEKTENINSTRERRNKHHVVPLKRDDECNTTTIMIKNIPYDCIRKVLINLLDEFCLKENEKAKNEGNDPYCAYDFVYVPIDFRSKRGRGFAFVNFTNSRAVRNFFEAFHRTAWTEFDQWSKKIEIVTAKLQGKEALVNHFTKSIFECETDEFLPALFSPPRNGLGQPVELTVVGTRRPPLIDSTSASC